MEEPPAIYVLIAGSCSKLICIDGHCVTLLLRGFSDNRLELEKFLAWLQLSPLPPLGLVPNCSQFG